MDREWTPVDCSTHAVRQQQRIGRRTSFWSAGPQVWSRAKNISGRTGN